MTEITPIMTSVSFILSLSQLSELSKITCMCKIKLGFRRGMDWKQLITKAEIPELVNKAKSWEEVVLLRFISLL